MRYWAVVTDTWRESWARKTSLVLSVLVLLIVAFYGAGLQLSPSEATPGEVYVTFFSSPPDPNSDEGLRMPTFSLDVIATISAVSTLGMLSPWGIFLGLFIAATLFVPTFRPQRLYWVLSKPLSRVGLMLSKYVGALVLVLLTSMVFIGLMTLLIGLKTDIYITGLLTGGLIVVFIYAIYASVAMLMAIWTRNTAMSLISVILLHIVSSVLYLGKNSDNMFGFIPEFGQVFIDIFYMILPKTSDLETLATQLIAGDLAAFSADIPNFTVDVPLAFGTSGTFLIVMLALSAWEFHRRDY